MRLALICRQNSCGLFHRYHLGYCLDMRIAVFGNKVNKGHPSCYHWPVFLSRIYRLGEKSRVAEGHEVKRELRGHAPRKVFEMYVPWDAIWCILKHNFEKCYRACTDLVASGWFFRYSYLYTGMITIFLGWKLGIWGGGGSFDPSNTLDRTLLACLESWLELIRSGCLHESRTIEKPALTRAIFSVFEHLSRKCLMLCKEKYVIAR